MNNSGQAVLEYILVLVVVVGIALGIMYQLNTAFKKYVQSYFGEYVACLLETGELPSLGSGDGASAEICSSSFEPFSLKNGRPLIASKGGGKTQGSASSKRGNTSSSTLSNGAGNSRFSKNNLTLNADRSRGDSATSANVEGKRRGSGGGDFSGDFGSASARRQADDGFITLSSKFKIKNDKEKETSKVQLNTKAKRSTSSSDKKIQFDPDKFKKKEQQADTDIKISFGEYLRYLLIFAIIVVIIVFFGGQLFQLKKSWDNN